MRVFVSHGSHDTWIARQMARCIEDAGAEVFLDVFDIQTGDDFMARIRDAIVGSDEMVVLLTPFSRRRTWLMNEIGLAWGLGKRIAPITYGMTMTDLDGEGGGRRGVLESRQFCLLNEFDSYLGGLRGRISDG
jgi:hypothetical protein